MQDESFSQPADYHLESELTAPIPRPVGDSIRRHPKRMAARSLSWRTSAIFAVLCALGLIFQNGVFMKAAGMYFTPFEYWWWVGWCCLACSLWGLVHFWYPGKKDPYLYLRQGIPLTVRVRDVCREVATRVNGNDTNFAYDVYVDFPDPPTQEMVAARLRSEQFAGHSRHIMCRVGDYLTAVYLPGQLNETLTLYGFTKIHPDRDLLVAAPNSVSKRAVLLGLGGLFALGWAIFRYPLTMTALGPALAALSFGSAAGTWFGYRRYQRNLAQFKAQLQQAVEKGAAIEGQTVSTPSQFGSLFGGLFCGGFVALGLVMLLNGALDHRTPKCTPVEVSQVYCTTYQGLVKTYEVEYKDPEGSGNHRIGISPLALLDEASYCELVVHPGALGMPWQELRLIH